MQKDSENLNEATEQTRGQTSDIQNEGREDTQARRAQNSSEESDQ